MEHSTREVEEGRQPTVCPSTEAVVAGPSILQPT